MSRRVPAPARRLILIGGMQRSGTSAVAAALFSSGLAMEFEQPGLELGRRETKEAGPSLPWKGMMGDPTRADGAYELFEIPNLVLFQEDLLGRQGASPIQPPLTGKVEIDFQSALFIHALVDLVPRFPFGLKDPRFAYTFSAWKIALAARRDIELVPVMVVRPPLEAARAVVKRQRVADLAGGLELWLRINSHVVRLCRQERAHVILYDRDADEFVANVRRLCRRLGLRFEEEGVREGFKPSTGESPDRTVLSRHPWRRSIEDVFAYLRRRAVTGR